jgi:hypothetical protein
MVRPDWPCQHELTCFELAGRHRYLPASASFSGAWRGLLWVKLRADEERCDFEQVRSPIFGRATEAVRDLLIPPPLAGAPAASSREASRLTTSPALPRPISAISL